VWRDHGEVEPPVVGAESDKNEDDDWMDDMVADISREYEVGSGEQGQPYYGGAVDPRGVAGCYS
jgi:hypothetical protein